MKFIIDQVIFFSLIKLFQKIFSLYFHNDPLSMDGSKTIDERKNYSKSVIKLFLIVIGQKKIFRGLENKFVNSNKLVVFQSVENSISILNKKELDNICRKT